MFFAIPAPQCFQQDRSQKAPVWVRSGFVYPRLFQQVEGFSALSSGSFTGSFRLRPFVFNKLAALFLKNQFLRTISSLFLRLYGFPPRKYSSILCSLSRPIRFSLRRVVASATRCGKLSHSAAVVVLKHPPAPRCSGARHLGPAFRLPLVSSTERVPLPGI